MQLDNVIVVYKKSTYEFYSKSKDERTRKYATGDNEYAERLRKADENNKRTIDAVVGALARFGIRNEVLYRADLHNFEHPKADLLIVVGGDGTFLEASHYIHDKTPILGINSDPERSVGYFCIASGETFPEILRNINGIKQTKLNRLELILDGEKLPELVLNDVLVAHPHVAAMTRYKLFVNNEEEYHKNSGLLIATAAGSTAWIYEEGGKIMPVESMRLQYKERGKRIAKLGFAEELKLVSSTREAKLYIDGAHLEYDFGLGSELIVRKGRPLLVIGDLREKR